MSDEFFMTVRELAIRRGVSLKAIYDQLAVGRLRGARKRGKIWLIPVGAEANYPPMRHTARNARPQREDSGSRPVKP